MMKARLGDMTVSAEWLHAILAFCPSVVPRAGRVQTGSEQSCFRSVSWGACSRHRDGAVAKRLRMLQLRLRPVQRFAEDKIIAVVPALPEPFAVLALMKRGIEPGNRQDLIAPDEASLVAEAFEIGKYILDIAGTEVPIFALENRQWPMLRKNSFAPLQTPEFAPLYVPLQQPHLVALPKIIIHP